MIYIKLFLFFMSRIFLNYSERNKKVNWDVATANVFRDLVLAQCYDNSGKHLMTRFELYDIPRI